MSGAATVMTAPPRRALAANAFAFVAFAESTIALYDVLRLDVVADFASRLIVVDVKRHLRVPRGLLHISPPLGFDFNGRAPYSGAAGGVR